MICLAARQPFIVVPNPNCLHLKVKSKPIFHFLSPKRNQSRPPRINVVVGFRLINLMAKTDSAREIMLTSGASGRLNALLSMQVLKSLLMLVHAIVLLLFFPFRRKRSHSVTLPEKGGKEEKQEASCSSGGGVQHNNRKGGVPVVRVPSTIVPWKSSVSAAMAVDQEVAARRALAIKRVVDGGESLRREFSLFVTPRGDIMFTQSWTPVSRKPRAVVVLLHGLNEHCGRYDEFAKQLNEHGYKVYGMDWVGSGGGVTTTGWQNLSHDSKSGKIIEGPMNHVFVLVHGLNYFGCPLVQKLVLLRHGGSDGLHAYVHSLDDAVTDVKAFISKVLAENAGLPCFCFGHSTGAAIILKAVLDPKVKKSIAGIVLTSPAVGVQPSHPIFAILAPIVSFLLPKYQFSAANKKGMPVSRDPAALVAKYSDPLVYTGSIRVRTGYEILRITSYLQRNMEKLNVPFFILHGTADTVTDPDASHKLYQNASSEDKSIRLLHGFLHDLLFEPERDDVARSIIQWFNNRV